MPATKCRRGFADNTVQVLWFIMTLMRISAARNGFLSPCRDSEVQKRLKVLARQAALSWGIQLSSSHWHEGFVCACPFGPRCFIIRLVSLVALDEAATPEYLRHDFLKPQLLPQSLARPEWNSVQERVWLQDEKPHCKESFRISLLLRHLPIERVDEEANFIATSNINETRFHKVGPHLV